MSKPTVQVIEHGVVLCDVRDKYPTSAVTRGDIALLPGGGLVARWFSMRRDGTTVRATADWADIRDVRRPLPHRADYVARFDTEREKRPDGWNRVSLGGDVPTLFQPGPILVRRRSTPGGGALFVPPDVSIDWNALIRRHAVEGDWGEHGRYEPDVLDEVKLWTLHRQPVAIQNLAAIAAAGGAVRSRDRVDEGTANASRLRPILIGELSPKS